MDDLIVLCSINDRKAIIIESDKAAHDRGCSGRSGRAWHIQADLWVLKSVLSLQRLYVLQMVLMSESCIFRSQIEATTRVDLALARWTRAMS